MNKKKIFDIAFYIFGTGVIAIVFFIVSINFYNNSRLLGQNYVVVDSVDNEDENSDESKDESKDDYNIEDENESEDSEFDTIKFEASEDVYIPISREGDKERGKYVEIEEQDADGICEEWLPRVLIYNHSGVEGIGDKIKENLENRDFCVELVNETNTRRGSTIVIEQTDDGFGIKVRDALKTGQLVRELYEEPEHHVIIAIGEDYVP